MEFRVLGPLEIRADGERPAAPTRRKQRLLLGMLCLHANEVVPRDTVVDWLWGEAPPVSAVANLQSYVSELRKVIGKERLRTGKDGYLLRIAEDELDAARFEGLAAEGTAAVRAGRPVVAVQQLGRALALWRDDVLSGLALPDAGRAEAARLDEVRLAAEEGHVEARLALGLHHEVVGELRKLVDRHPLREGVWAQYALALYRCGRQAEALDAHRDVRDLLDRELGVRPGARLRDLQLRMLRADPDLDLKPVVAVASAPRQLPAGTRGFIGRQAELAELDSLPDSTGVGLVTGAPGVGKTALALHWAHRVRERFPDGHLYSTGATPVDVLGRFLRALGVAPERVPTDVDEASSVFRTLLADRRVLIVLDNVESAEDARPLLPAGNGCFALVTSRDRLNGLVVVDGAHRMTLSVLPAEESAQLLVGALGERRAAAEPDAVAELADLCGHLPLALRIAAANLTNAPFRTLSEGVRDLTAGGLSSLVVPGAGDLAVRRAFDMSYRAPTQSARRLFRKLGLLPGPSFSVESATALAGAGDLRTLLDELANAHLVVQSDRERFVMHDLLRMYAAELAEAFDDAEDRATATRALVGAYATAVERAAAGIASGDPDARDRAMRWTEAELPNLVAVAETAAEVGCPDAAWRIAEQLGGYFWLSRPVSHWLRLAKAAEDAACRAGDHRALAAAKRLLGEARHCLGQNDEAIVHLTDALRLARESGDRAAEAANLMFLGLVEQDRGRLSEAERHFNDCMGSGDRLMEAGAKGNLGYVRQLMGRYDAAEELYRWALTCYDEIDPALVGSACNMLALLAHERGRYDDAMEHVETALSLSRGYDRGVEAHALDTLARLQRDTGRLDAALETAQRSMELAVEIADVRAETDALNTLGSIELLAGRLPAAAQRHTSAVTLARRSGVVAQQLESLLGEAKVVLAMGEADAARELLRDVEQRAAGGSFAVLAATARALRESVN
ncbi:BTAD domain-containing putative transcriptional regulator [Saccharothrix mutabilis subsp. mutabilis]|uniref:BTAD domain-containing putative transcriptional regulator n=1 Tax=Saccharothrix mutabilis subsp. mutabilis TaxID=66855 RepID=A0ABN0T168_9PSEU